MIRTASRHYLPGASITCPICDVSLSNHICIVTIPPLDPSARDEEESNYDEEALVWAAAMEHAAEVEDEETPDEYDWQISRLVSAATYTAGPDAGRVSTGRMKIT